MKPRDPHEPDDADIREEAAYEESHRRRVRDPDGGFRDTIPASAWTSGTWAKLALVFMFAAPGFWMAFNLPHPGRDGEGFLQIAIMGIPRVPGEP